MEELDDHTFGEGHLISGHKLQRVRLVGAYGNNLFVTLRDIINHLSLQRTDLEVRVVMTEF